MCLKLIFIRKIKIYKHLKNKTIWKCDLKFKVVYSKYAIAGVIQIRVEQSLHRHNHKQNDCLYIA